MTTVPAPSRAAAPAWEPRRAHRAGADRVLGGVAAGVAHHLGWRTAWVRAGLVVTTVLGGFGAVLYAALWLVLPLERADAPGAPGIDAATRQGRRGGRRERRLTDYGPLAAGGAIAAGVVLALGVLTGQALAVGPLLVAACGVALLWWQADQAQQERWADGARVHPLRAVVGAGGWAAYLRIAAGLALVVLAVTLFGLRGGLSVALDVGLAASVGLLGVGLVIAPWFVRLSSDLSAERVARVREQERADVAAHLHDSVLQTLALIQRSAADPATVARLARAQERDLRRWLFEPDAAGPTTLATALRAAASEVEDGLGVPVEVVCVGDATLAEGARPLVLAAREAMLNAARHSGAGSVDVYAEAGPEGLEVFVRDRGRGFDPDVVPDDRQGLRGSVLGRVRRHGGRAEVRSAPGHGTEVRLWLPRADQPDPPPEETP
ncbi:ATP-binding protein [Nocardioides marmoraquaticus]